MKLNINSLIKTVSLTLATISTLAFSAGALAQKPAKAAMCAACHGAGGAAPIAPTYPKIAGQNAGYLEIALKAYRDGNRKNATAMLMTGQATGLSDAEIKELAAFYSAQ